jgi:hypothetical protein
MEYTEVRLRCVEAAVKVVGNPNTLQQAQKFYEFVVEGHEDATHIEGELSDHLTGITPTETPLSRSLKKGSRK